MPPREPSSEITTMRLTTRELQTIGLNNNQIDALCSVDNYGVTMAAPSTVASLLKRGLIERTGQYSYRATQAGDDTVRQIRAMFGE